MRWSRAARLVARALSACVALAAATVATAGTESVMKTSVDVMAVGFEEFGATGAAIGEVVVGVLAARGVEARRVSPPPECDTPDSSACMRGALAALARGALAVAVVPAARVPPPPALRDAGLEELGEVAPPARRSCRALGGALRSLPELAEPARAAPYALSAGDLRAALAAVGTRSVPLYHCANGTVIVAFPETCAEAEYATILTGTESEAGVAAEVVRQHGLRAHVLALGTPAPPVAAALRLRHPALLCGRALAESAGGGGRALGPPPCPPDAPVCPFESRRLVKLVNMHVLAHAPSAVRALTRVELDARSLRALARRAGEAGAESAAREAAGAHPAWARAAGEVRAAVMVPLGTAREAYDAPALRAAAELAELDAAQARYYLDDDGAATLRPTGAAGAAGAARAAVVAVAGVAAVAAFKVELLDDGCTATRAFKYLTDALGTEFGALSGVVGPACGGAFQDVTRQSPALALPVLAYTAQAPPAGDAAALTLLAAGDARRTTTAWAALMARSGWRRAAVLSELATRATLDVARLGVDVLAHLELPGDGDTFDDTLVRQWAERVAAANGRIIYLCVEDARAVRAALCAGRGAGLAPVEGAVWLLPAALPAGWLRPSVADTHNCTLAQLAEMAEGHLTVAPEWAVRWESGAGAGAGAGTSTWRGRWRARCGPACSRPPPSAALLYDVLRLWADALGRLLHSRPAALDDLHRDDLVRSLIEDVTSRKYTGLTGTFTWEGMSRAAALILLQWRNGTRVPVGTWRGEGDALALVPGEPRWLAGAGGGGGGEPPDDGGERCALRALADALNVECRVAFGAIGAVLVAALLTTLAGAAWHCRRRAEREFRARLIALDMRTLGPKFGGLDRWEVPRERVVINRKLGTGAFGTVYGGHALLSCAGGSGRGEERGWAAVAVKTLKAGATTDEKLDFLSEAEAMKRFDHKNVVRLLGVVTKTEPVCTVMEYMLYGDLKNYLVSRRQLAGAGGSAGGAEVSPARLTAMALDVARALSYLAQLRYVHRDVAARNCLVSATRVVKLADFGMTRLVFENDYYRFSRKGMLPVRWMAPESLALGVFSPASDVWSFGVLLYEIVTFGSLPFQGLANSEVLDRVKAGHTLDLPPGLKPQLEGLIKSCWQRERRARPKAAAVAAFLAESPRLLTPCLDVPLDALPLPLEAARSTTRDADTHEARWVSWAAPTSAGTDSTYLSADGGGGDGGRECDAFLPHPAPPSASCS